MQLDPSFQLWKVQPPWPCSALPGPTARLEQGEPPSGRCHASTLPRKGIILRQKPMEASEPQEQSISQRKNDTGVQGIPCAAAKFTTCKSTISLPHQWGPSVPQRHPQLEHAHHLSALTVCKGPTARACNCSCNSAQGMETPAWAQAPGTRQSIACAL